MTRNPFAFDHPDAAIEALANQLAPRHRIRKAEADIRGKILAEDITADRPSPAANVSAMDGYGLRVSDLALDSPIRVAGESACGSAPPNMPENAVIRVFTGAIVPSGCELVVKREDTTESENEITLSETTKKLAVGANIRRSGENLRANEVVFTAGTRITPASHAALVNFGAYQVDVFEPVRVAIITTGEELIAPEKSPGKSPKPWQLHNSNQFGLTSLLASPSIEISHTDHVGDDRATIEQLLQERLKTCDAIILTGGVSMGDYDFVPEAVSNIGGEIIFHGLPIRPGKPILGASSEDGKLIIGLPGNPVSAMVNARRIGVPLLAKLSGQLPWMPPTPWVSVADLRKSDLPLHRYLLTRLGADGQCHLVPSKGSGDLVALGQSDGFVEIPIASDPQTPKRFFRWT